MKKRDDVIIQAILEACAEVGIHNGVQGFAANLGQHLAQIEKTGKLSMIQVALALGWEGKFIFGNRIQRKPFAELILRKVEEGLRIADHPFGSDAWKKRAEEGQLRLWV